MEGIALRRSCPSSKRTLVTREQLVSAGQWVIEGEGICQRWDRLV